MSEEGSLVPGIQISASGLDAQSRRMEVIANNVANAHTTSGTDGKVFRRKQVLFAAKLADALKKTGRKGAGMGGVEISRIEEDPRPPKRVHRPGHPDADKDGFVNMPNVNAAEEMVDMMSATRAYEANLAAIRAARLMAKKALEIGK